MKRITQEEADSIERLIEDKHRIFTAATMLNSVNCLQYGVSVDEYMAASKAIGVIAEKVMNEVEKLIKNDQKSTSERTPFDEKLKGAAEKIINQHQESDTQEGEE